MGGLQVVPERCGQVKWKLCVLEQRKNVHERVEGQRESGGDERV